MTPERYRRICDTLDRRQPDLTVIMDGVHKPHNIAAIVRTCDAVGIMDVHAILPNNRARMAAGTAMGSLEWRCRKGARQAPEPPHPAAHE